MSSRGSAWEAGGTGVWCFVNELSLFQQSVGEECQSVTRGCSTKVEKETVSSVSLQ